MGGLSGPIYHEFGKSARFVTFYSNGRVFLDSAEEGMDAFDPDTDSTHGSYQVLDDEVVISWSDGQTVASPIAPDGSLVLYDVKYTPLPVCDGLVLDGTYGRDWSNEYVEHRTIHFSSAGRFEDTGILPQTGLSLCKKYLESPPSWSSDHPLVGSGTYQIRGNTLYLEYDSGAQETVEVYIEPQHVGKQPMPEVVIGGFEFERKKT